VAQRIEQTDDHLAREGNAVQLAGGEGQRPIADANLITVT
jgi:hypothetical protein